MTLVDLKVICPKCRSHAKLEPSFSCGRSTDYVNEFYSITINCGKYGYYAHYKPDEECEHSWIFSHAVSSVAEEFHGRACDKG